MVDTAYIKEEISNIKIKLAELSECVDDNSKVDATEILQLTRRLYELELKVTRLDNAKNVREQPNKTIIHEQVYTENQNQNFNVGVFGTQSRDNSYNNFQIPVQPRIRRNISEMNIGKYILAVLASILVIIAVILFAGTVWDIVPPAAKMLVILLIGIMMTVFGGHKVLAKEKFNGFWVSLTSCGQVILFIDIICGNTLWEIYGITLTGVLLGVWFITALMLAKKAESNIFYVISHFGALVSIWLTMSAVGDISNITDQALILVVILIWTFVSRGGRLFKSNIKVESITSMIFTIICSIIAVYAFVIGDSALGIGLELSIVILYALLINVDAHNMCRDTSYDRIIRLLFNQYTSIYAIISVRFITSSALVHRQELLAVIIVFAVFNLINGFIHKNKYKDIILDTMPITVFLIGEASDTFLGNGAIIISILTLMLITASNIIKNQRLYFRYLTIISYVVSTIFFIFYCDMDTRTISYIALLLVSIIEYITSIKDRIGYTGIRQSVSILTTFILILFTVDIEDGCLIAVAVIYSLICILHKLIVSYRVNRVSSTDKWVDIGICSLIMWLIHIWSYAAVVFELYSTIEVLGYIMLLIALSSFGIYESLKYRGKLRTVISVISCNITIFVITLSWNGADIMMLLVSIIGIAISGMFITLGFIFRHKIMRVLGLITIIIYVIKIAFIDTAIISGGGLSIAMIAFAGVMCFAISFVYNRLDKVYGRDRLVDKI